MVATLGRVRANYGTKLRSHGGRGTRVIFSSHTEEELRSMTMRWHEEQDRERTCFIHPRLKAGLRRPMLSLVHSLPLECRPTALFEKQVSALLIQCEQSKIKAR